MGPLFPDNVIEEVENWNGFGSKFKIRPECTYFKPEFVQTGNEEIKGDMFRVPAAGGELVAVWVAREQDRKDHLKYFCHGYTFGTYEKFQYSVIEVDKLLQLEWEILLSPLKVSRSTFFNDLEFDTETEALKVELHKKLLSADKAGQKIIAICFDAKDGIVHSFRVNDIVPLEQKFLNCGVGSKNTFGHFDNKTTIKKQLYFMQQISSLAFFVQEG